MNYTDLKAEIADYLDRSDLTDVIPGFITKCENKLNRRLRLREQNQLSTSTLSSGRFVALPTGFIELLDLQIKKATESDTEYEPVKYEAPELLYKRYEDTEGTPGYYTLRDQFEFNQGVSEDHTLRLHYLKKWDIETDTTNWLLTNYEDVYLYGSLMEAVPYLKDTELVAIKVLFDQVIEELNEMDMRSEDDAVLGTDVHEISNRYSTFNIIDGV